MLTLVITIIVILAASVVLTLNNSNIITNASTARYESDRDTMQSILDTAIQKVIINNKGAVEIKVGMISRVLDEVSSTTGEVVWTSKKSPEVTGKIIFGTGVNNDTTIYTEKELPIYGNNTKWYVDENGKIVLQVGIKIYGANEIPKEKFTAKDIKKNPSQYYGKEIKSYECENSETNWQIFYADEKNIYIIAKDNIPYKYVPEGRKGTLVTEKNEPFSFNDIYKDYTGGIDIIGDVRKWVSYLDYRGESENKNMKVVAYLLDTIAWSKFAGNKAMYAIGSPTLDLFVASYNDLNTNKKIEYESNSHGYRVRLEGEGEYNTFVKNLVENDFKILQIHLASPSYYSEHLMNVRKNAVDCTMYTYSLGLRPVVCLKPEVKLEKLDDGTYKVI